MIRPTCLVLAAGLLACAGPRVDPAPTGWRDLDAEVRPTLEEIFLEPPLSGEPPVMSSFSPNGRWLVLRWGEPPEPSEGTGDTGGTGGTEPPEDGAEAERPPLRLLDLEHPEQSDHRGVPLAELVPQVGGHGDEEKIGPVEWAHHGALLAIARGPDIFLFDPTNERIVPFLLPPVEKPEEDDEANAENDPEAPAAEPEEETAPPEVAVEFEGRVLHDAIKSIRFRPDDRQLRFADAKELYSLPLRGGLPDEPASLEDARVWSEAITPKPLSAYWSGDLSVVFSVDPPLVKPEEKEADESTDEEELEAEPIPHVLHVNEGRFVTLEGVAEMKKLEATSLSPDGRFAVGAEYDRETEPKKTIVPDYLTERVTTKKTRNLLADDGPSPFTLYMWNTSSGERMQIFPKDEDGIPVLASAGTNGDAPEENPEAKESGRREGDHWLRTIGWAPNDDDGGPARFAYELISADFRELEIWCWTEGFCERLWFERDERWVGGPARYARWTDDGTRLIVGSESYAESSTPGRCQVFSVDPDTREVVQLTAVAGEVRRFQTTDDGALVYQASEEDLAQSVLGWLPAVQVRGNFRPEPQTFPAPAGWNSSFRCSSDGTRVVFEHESLFSPAELWMADRDQSRRLTRTTPEAFGEVDWIEPERISLESEDGRTVWAHVFLPPGTSLAAGANDAPRASIVFVHGAGYLQNVTDSMTRYPPNLMFHSRLAQLGYPVIDVDYRGSAGYGRDFRTDVQYHLGGKDLDDIHLVVDELVERGLVDAERVGLYGGSYGGFMTMMALFTAPDRWAAGAALRSVTDWRTYHPWYTQPRLGRPSTHAEAYERSSPIDHVEKLEDPLLVLHGMMDRNVFAQDSIRLIEALIDQGSDFDAMLYPSQGHGFEDGPHWLDEYRRIERYLLMHLGPPVAEPEAAQIGG